MSINNVGYKSNSINTDPKVDTIGSEEIASSTDSTLVDDTFGIPDVPGSESAAASAAPNPFDDYLCGDTTGGVIDNPTANDPGMINFMNDFPPSLESVLEGNEKAIQYLDIIKGRYEQSRSDIQALKKSAEDTLFTGNVTAGEATALQTKIEAYNVALARCEKELSKTNDLIELNGNIYLDELRQGRDLNGDRWIGRPNKEGSYGICTTASGKTVYIDPTTGVAMDRPPYSDPDYIPKLATGNIAMVDEKDVGVNDMHPTADVTLQLTSGESADNDFGTPYEVCGVQYFWVKRDGTSFDPKLDFQVASHDLENPDKTPSETHYSLAEFETVNGEIVQKVPEDRSKYIQVEVAEVTVTSEPVDDGKGFDHFIEYFDKKGTLICRMRITGYDSDVPLAYGRPLDMSTGVVETAEGAISAIASDPNGPCRVYASTLGFAFNTDNVYSSGMKYDFSAYQSTGRHIVESMEKLEEALGLERPRTSTSTIEAGITGKADSKDRAYMSYMENLSLFSEEDNRMWMAYSGESGTTFWEPQRRDYDFQGGHDIYIDPTSAALNAAIYSTAEGRRSENHDETTPDTISSDLTANTYTMRGGTRGTETIATPLTGVMMYGLGTRGHIIGTNYNDIIHVADANALYDSDYYRDHYPDAEPIKQGDPLYATVVEAGSGNNIVRGYSGDHYVSGATLAWIDGTRRDNNYIMTQGAPDAYGGYDDDGNPIPPVNPKNYVHVDAPGGEIAIHNPNEEDAVMAGSIDPGKENKESPWLMSTYDDHYDLTGGQISFTNLSDQDAIDAIGRGMINNGNQGSEDAMGDALSTAADKIFEEICKIEQPDEVEAFVDEWMVQSGHTAEAQTEMNDFFGSMFGLADDIWSEFSEEEAKKNSEASPI